MQAVRTLVCASLSFLFVIAQAYAQDAPQRPKYQLFRQNEDWSQFRGGDGAFDKIKHININSDGSIWLSLGGRADTRLESWENFGFGTANDDDFILTRGFLHADVHFGKKMRVFVEGKTAQSTERELPGGRRGLDVDTIAVHQAFADFQLVQNGDSSLRLRAGRQMFIFGAQRLISPLPWANTFRTWDGISAQWQKGGWTIDGFYSHFVPVRKTRYNRPNDDLEFYGVHATRKPKKGERGYDVYVFGTTRPGVTVNGTTGNERRHTIGGRTWGPLGDGFDGELEAAYQVGEVGSGDVNAWSVTGVLGHTPDGWKGKPRFFVGIDAASGDTRPGGSVGTFNQLYPLGHAYLGWADIIARQNVLAGQIGVSINVAEKTNAKVVGHFFRLMERNDAFYNVGGGVAQTGLSSRDVAQELDLLVTHKVSAAAKIYGGYSYVFGGGGLTAAATDDIAFFYLGASYMF